MKVHLTLALLFASRVVSAGDMIQSAEAKDHIGETATVCGKVSDARYVESSHVTFLNFD